MLLIPIKISIFPLIIVPILPPITTLKEAKAITVPRNSGKTLCAVTINELCIEIKTAPKTNNVKMIEIIEEKFANANTDKKPNTPVRIKNGNPNLNLILPAFLPATTVPIPNEPSNNPIINTLKPVLVSTSFPE